MKKFTLFFSALLFSMMSFAGVVTFDADADKGNAGTDSNNAAAYTITKSGVTVEVSSGILGTYNNETHYRVYKNQTLTVKSTVGNITSVEFTCTANGDAKYGPGCFTASTGDYTNDGGAVGTWTGSATEIVFTATSNQVRATQIVVTVDGEVTDTPETPETPEQPETPETPENPGTTTIEIPAEAQAWNIPAEAIDVLQAREICAGLASGETTGTKYYVMGYVKKLHKNHEFGITGYGNATFYMENVNGADSQDDFLAFQVYGPNGEKLSDPATVAVGDFVVIYGELTNYMDDTYETVGKGAAYIWNSTNPLLAGGETPEQPEEPETPETPETPEGVITCAEAVAICETTGSTLTTESYTIRGYVTEIKYAWSEQYGTATFWIADTQDGGKVLQAYSCAPLADTDKVFAVGAYVELVGKLKQYNTTNEVEKGTYTILVAGETPEQPEQPETPDVTTEGDGTAENPYTVEDVLALNNTSKGPHYVKGFIIGQVNGPSIQSGLDTEAPFEGSTNSDGSVATQGTNLMIAGVVGETTNIVAVQLPKGELRDAFNLVENPDMLGKEVLICGNLEKYFGTAGIKSPTSIEVIGGGNDDVVNVKDLQYADAYYYEDEGVAYYDIRLYNDIDPDTYGYVYPELYIATEAKSKTALNGTYDLLYAGYWTSANDSVEIGETMGTVTIKNVDEESNYSFVGSFVGEDGKTYKFNQVVNVYAEDVDADYAEIELSEEATETPENPNPETPEQPETPAGDIVFDADVDQGNAGTDSNNATAYQITKSGVTMEVSSGILGTYNNEMHYRVYKNQTLTLTSTVGNIVKVEFTCTANGDAKYGPGCFTASTGDYTNDGGAVGTWTGSATEIVFTAASNQVRATQVVVTLAQTGTGVEDVETVEVPVKVLNNGQLMIISGKNVYNVLGAQVK